MPTMYRTGVATPRRGARIAPLTPRDTPRDWGALGPQALVRRRGRPRVVGARGCARLHAHRTEPRQRHEQGLCACLQGNTCYSYCARRN